MDEKEKKEFTILKKIYKLDNYKNIVKRENPDFELEQNSGYKFGAEITEFYFSESNARVRNIPSYISNILSDRTFKHKNDIEKLKVDKFVIISDGKPDREINGIIQKLPERDEFINMIVEVINHKLEKYDNYDGSLGHINLIIYDMENRYLTLQREDFYQFFCNYNLFLIIKNSSFREIYFITKFRDTKQYYFPLRQILLMSEIYLLNGFLGENKEYLFPFNDYKDEKIIYSFLLSQGINSAFLVETENNTELFYSNYGILIDDKSNRITLHDYAEYPLPTQNIIDENSINKIDSKIINEFVEFKKHYTFQNSIGFDVN